MITEGLKTKTGVGGADLRSEDMCYRRNCRGKDSDRPEGLSLRNFSVNDKEGVWTGKDLHGVK